MKIEKLQILDKTVYVGEQQGKTLDLATHDFERMPDGYLVRHRKSGDVYFVPLSLAVAKVSMDPETVTMEPETEEEDADAGEPADRRPAGRRGRPKASTPPVQT